MVLVQYHCPPARFSEHFKHKQKGGLNVYRGRPWQRGTGVGGFFGRALFRATLPLLKIAGKSLLRQGARMASGFLKNVADGKSLGNILGTTVQRGPPQKRKQSLTTAQPNKKRRVVSTKVVRRVRRVRSTRDIFDKPRKL